MTNFNSSKLKTFQTTVLNFMKIQKVLLEGRKQCGKRINCSLLAFSPFPAEFSKDKYCRHVKTRDCLGKGLNDQVSEKGGEYFWGKRKKKNDYLQ